MQCYRVLRSSQWGYVGTRVVSVVPGKVRIHSPKKAPFCEGPRKYCIKRDVLNDAKIGDKFLWLCDYFRFCFHSQIMPFAHAYSIFGSSLIEPSQVNMDATHGLNKELSKNSKS